MSDHEFENYLTLIGRLLRLSRAQREAIGEELRDHFESRLAELMGRGISHAEAVRIALEEFGDAAGLAAHFSSIAQNRKRRIIMRCTVASVTALAAAFVVALCLWPDTPAHKLIPHATADGTDKPSEDKQKELDKLVKAAQELPDDLTARTEAALNQRQKVEFMGTPLVDVCDYLIDSINGNDHHSNVQLHFDVAALKDAGIDPNTSLVTIKLEARVSMLLDLILGEFNLGYTIRDGIVFVTTKEKLDATLETRVYDCRDILSADTERFNRYPTAISAPKDDGKIHTPRADLIDVVVTSVAPKSWSQLNGPGSICEYDGLLVVSQTAAGQSEVADLLEKLSTRLSSRPGKSNETVPGPK